MKITGPLGIWPFPILNFILELADRLKRKSERRPILQSRLQTTVVRNVEEISWIDWKGRERKMIIHREVK